MSSMFSQCLSLYQIPDISKWDISDVKYLNELFYNCESLISLPDISKWNTSNVIDLNYMFCNCSALLSGSYLIYRNGILLMLLL